MPGLIEYSRAYRPFKYPWAMEAAVAHENPMHARFSRYCNRSILAGANSPFSYIGTRSTRADLRLHRDSDSFRSVQNRVYREYRNYDYRAHSDLNDPVKLHGRNAIIPRVFHLQEHGIVPAEHRSQNILWSGKCRPSDTSITNANDIRRRPRCGLAGSFFFFV